MALNFGILDPDAPAKLVGSVYAGQQQRQQNELAQQQQRQQNELAQQQAAARQQELGMRQQEFGLRQQEFAQSAEERQAKLQRAQGNQTLLANLSSLMEKNGQRLDRPTLGSMLQMGLQTNQDALVQVATKGLQALDEQEQFQSEMGQFKPATTPAATNALAPAVATPPTTAAASGYSRPQIENMLTSPNARVREMGGKLLGAMPKEAVDPADLVMMRQLGYPQTPAGFQAYRDDQRQERMLTPEEERQKIRIAAAGRAPRAEAAPRTQQVTLDDGSLGIVNMDTGVITRSTVGGAPVKGKPSATAEKTAIQRKQLGLDLDRAIIELEAVTKEGGLIDQSTGSGAGRLIDLAAGFGGQAMPGAIAIGELQPIADMALKMVPRFEGPQSNADTTSYKQAAGQLADPTLPREIRKKAGKTVLRLMKDRKGQFASTAMEAEGVSPAPAAAGGVIDFGSLR